ncbi:MAG: photosynthetic reaction center cytochrome c subunit family protein [Acidobacteriota bacterium]|nr:photosynthetic reaction center cytochrome c subunit family protein [Acidobacteriota bacterium]
MKRTLAFALLFAALTVSSQTTEDKPMEQTKKNIRVLTGVPSSQLIPIMAVMSNSLGVTCTHCHEASDWSSDAKPAKDVSRRMIQMTRAINDSHYGGKVVVTCNTCHHGSVGTSPTPPVANAGWNKPATFALQPALPAADELFARHMRAVTPAARRNARAMGIVTARSGRGDPRSAPFELVYAPGKTEVHTELSYPPEGERELGFPPNLRERYANVVTRAVDELRGRTVYVVEATPKDGSMSERLSFDAATGLLLQWHRERATIIGVLAEEYEFDDYRNVEGAQFPFVMQWSRADYQVTHRIASIKPATQ